VPAALLLALTLALPAGAIRGTVVDADFQSPLAEARVSVVQLAQGTLSSDDGTFLLQGLPPGTYTLVVYKDGYERQIIPDVAVGVGRMTDVQVTLVSEVVDLEELVVSGMDLLGDSEAGLLELRSTALAMQDAVSAEVMSRAGASDVGAALKMVVGTSVAEGKYATVRGLSDRYTGTTLNGVRVPSADPRRRAVQVDLFPTGTIESLTVTKTFTPDLQGDFTGGGIDIKTKAIPDGPMLNASYSPEYDSEATHNSRFLTYGRGGVHGLGFDAGRHALPGAAEALKGLPPPADPKPKPSDQQMELAATYDRIVRAFDPTMGVSRSAPGPNRSLYVVAGDRFALSEGRTMGVIGAVTYSHKYDFFEGGTNNNGGVSQADQPISLTKARTDSQGTDEVLAGAMATVMARPSENNEVSLALIYNHAAEDTSRFQVQPIGASLQEVNQALHYTERDVGSVQLHHRHGPQDGGKTQVDWFVAWNFTRQLEPDVRFFRYSFDLSSQNGGFPLNSTAALNSRRIFRKIGEDDLQGGLDVTLPFMRLTDAKGSIKGGLYFQHSNRDYDQRSFTYVFQNQLGPVTNPAVAENKTKERFQGTDAPLWTDVFNDPSRIGLAPNRCAVGAPFVNCALPNQLLWTLSPLGNDVNYTGDQSIFAFYAMSELPLTHRLKAIFGARLERTSLAVSPVNPLSGFVEGIEIQESGDRALVPVAQADARAQIDEVSFLPSIGLAWEVRPQMHLRGSWSKTIARPTFRELAPVATEEFLFGDEFLGNPDLKLSSITNWDLRWEWFRRPGDVFSVSLFTKKIENPIELISFGVSNRVFVQPVNFETGQVHGAEFESRLDLGQFTDRLHGLALGANLAKIDSDVDVPQPEQDSLAPFALGSAKRRLQGQPDLVSNVHLTYDNERLGVSTGLFYNHSGETLSTGAARGVEDGIPDVFTLASRSLDFTFNQNLDRPDKHVSVGFKVRNLLRDESQGVYRTPTGQEAVKYARDTSLRYSLSASVKW
jgi:TonB-dependent receptor